MIKKIILIICLLALPGWVLFAQIASGATSYVWKNSERNISQTDCSNTICYSTTGWNDISPSGASDLDLVYQNYNDNDTMILSGGVSGVSYSGTDIDSDGQWYINDFVNIRGCSPGDTGYAEHGGHVTLISTGNNLLATHSTSTNGTEIKNLTLAGGSSQVLNLTCGGILFEDVTIDGTGESNSECVSLTGTATFNRVNIKNCTDYGIYAIDGVLNWNYGSISNTADSWAYLLTNDPAITLNNVAIYNNKVYAWLITGTPTLTLKNSIVIGNDTDGNHNVIRKDAGTVNISNSILLPNYYNGADPYASFDTNTNPVYYLPKWKQPNYGRTQPAIAISFDDSSSINDFLDHVNIASSYGVPLTIFIDGANLVTSGQWDGLAACIANGTCGVGNHFTIHTNKPYYTTGIEAVAQVEVINSIQYLSGTCEITVATSTSTETGEAISGTITLSGDCSGEFGGQIDLTSASYDTIGELCDAIDADSDFSCVEYDGYDNINSVVLENAVFDIATTESIDSEVDRWFDWQVLKNKIDIEDAIRSRSGTYPSLSNWVCDTVAYPANEWGEVSAQELNERGIKGARSGATGEDYSTNLMSHTKLYAFAGEGRLAEDGFLSSVEQARQTALSMVAIAQANGYYSTTYWHAVDIVDAYDDEWEAFYSALGGSNVQTLTFSDLVDHARSYAQTCYDDSNGTSEVSCSAFAKDDGILSIKMTPVIVADLTLQSNSPAIDAGTPLWTAAAYPGDFAGTAEIYGRAPDIGAYEYKSKKSLFPVMPVIFSKPDKCRTTDSGCYLQP